MTAKEYLRGKIADFLLPSNTITVILAENNLADEQQVSKDDSVEWVRLRRAYADALCYVLRLPASVTQGTFNKSDVNRDWYKKELEVLAEELQDPDIYEFVAKPDITRARQWD